jgi:hypothetical protein
LQAEWPEKDIVTLVNITYERSGFEKRPDGYCVVVIQEARMRTKTGNLDFASEELLSRVSDIWGLQIKAVIKHGKENAIWHLHLFDGREIQLGESKDFISQTKVRTQIFDVTGTLIPRYPPRDARLWDKHIEWLALAATTVDTPEMTDKGYAKFLVLGYLESHNCELDREVDSEEREDLALKNLPFVRQGIVHVSAKHMFTSYIRATDNKMTHRGLLNLLRKLDGYDDKVTIEHPKTSRKYWFLPLEQFKDDANASLP